MDTDNLAPKLLHRNCSTLKIHAGAVWQLSHQGEKTSRQIGRAPTIVPNIPMPYLIIQQILDVNTPYSCTLRVCSTEHWFPKGQLQSALTVAGNAHAVQIPQPLILNLCFYRTSAAFTMIVDAPQLGALSQG